MREDPLLAVLEAAPFDHEPLTDEDIAAIDEGVAEHERGETGPWEDVRRERLGG